MPDIFGNSKDKLDFLLIIPEGEGRKGEGGLRTKGHLKQSLPNKPLVTVITVVLNGEAYLEETIQSVIRQTYHNVEYIVIDGGSSDGTLDIIRKYEYAIDYWVSERDRGIYDAMNKGIDLASGRWVNFMNGGDRFLQNETLDLSILQFEKNETVAGYYSDSEIAYSSGFIRTSRAIEMSSAWKKMPFQHQAFFAQTQILRKNKFSLDYAICSDYNQVITMLMQGYILKKISNVICRVAAGGIADSRRSKVFAEYHQIGRAHKIQGELTLVLYFSLMQIENIFRRIAKKVLPSTGLINAQKSKHGKGYGR